MVAEGIQTEYKKFSHNKYMTMGKRVHLLTSVCFFFKFWLKTALTWLYQQVLDGWGDLGALFLV